MCFLKNLKQILVNFCITHSYFYLFNVFILEIEVIFMMNVLLLVIFSLHLLETSLVHKDFWRYVQYIIFIFWGTFSCTWYILYKLSNFLWLFFVENHNQNLKKHSAVPLFSLVHKYPQITYKLLIVNFVCFLDWLDYLMLLMFIALTKSRSSRAASR